MGSDDDNSGSLDANGPVRLVELAARARARRKSLGMASSQVAASVGCAPWTFSRMEERLNQKVSKFEAKWEIALRVPQGWLRNIEVVIEDDCPVFMPLNERDDATVLDQMTHALCWYVRTGPRRTSNLTNLSKLERRSLDMLLQRFGSLGEEHSTLAKIGEYFGLTRERVRKILERFEGHYDDPDVDVPLLAKIVDLAQPMLPMRSDELQQVLSQKLGGKLSIEGVARFSEDVLHKTFIRLEARSHLSTSNSSVPMALPNESPGDELIRSARQVALAMIRACGGAQIQFVAGLTSDVMKFGVSPDDVLVACRMFGSFEWLVESDGWFWFGHERDNRVKDCAMKILSIADRFVDVDEIYSALSRTRLQFTGAILANKSHALGAPVHVLKEIIGRIPGIETSQHNNFKLTGPKNISEVLNGTEFEIYQYINSCGGIVSRKSVHQAVVDTGFTGASSVNNFFDSSPIIKPLDSGLWILCGTRLNASALLAAQGQI